MTHEERRELKGKIDQATRKLLEKKGSRMPSHYKRKVRSNGR